MGAPQVLDRFTIVLSEPQDPVNIGAVIRAMKNMGLSRLHVVRPADFDAYRIEGVAHTGRDIIASTRFFDSLTDAISEARLVIGTSARGRRVRRNYRKPKEATSEAVELATGGGEVAFVFGREDRGLSNADLDLCDRVVTIPTDPQHTSLNLAHAVMIVAYELFTVARGELPAKQPRVESTPASSTAKEDLYWEVEASLHAIDFFKSHKVTPIMRTIREVASRADLDESEAALFRAIAIEVQKYIERKGLG